MSKLKLIHPESDHSISDYNMLHTIEAGKRQLEGYYKRTPGPELAWELRLYDWILMHPDPAEMAYQYLTTRMEPKGPPLPKREVVKKLGWHIP